MYKGFTVIALIPVFNEQAKIVSVLTRLPRAIIDEVVVLDDGSTDQSAESARQLGATVLSMEKRTGVGAALRRGYYYAREKDYAISVTLAGNNKDAPEEIPLLLDPIVHGQADFAQGTRYGKRGAFFGPMPLYRRVAVRLHARLFSLVVGRRVTDSTNGFRAFRTQILNDPGMDLSPQWLNHYELEVYFYISVYKMGYRVVEIPVTKVYPPKKLGQTKMTPVIGWWSMLRPLFYYNTRRKQERDKQIFNG